MLCCPAFAQTKTYFSEVVEVRIMNIDVVVTGRDGKPVTGLTRDEFELYEDGARKEISNFLELRGESTSQPAAPGGAPAAAPASEDMRRRDITIFVDNAVLQPHRRNRILPHLSDFIAQTVRPGDSVAIVVWGPSLKVELEPTADRAAIATALTRLASQSTLSSTDTAAKDEFYRAIALLVRAYADRGVPGQPPPKPPWSSALSEARSYAARAVHDSKQRVEALKSVIAWRRGVDARKILVLLTTELAKNPAEEPFLYLDAIREQFDGSSTTARADAAEFETTSLVTEIAEVANSSGVTVYPIDSRGKEGDLVDRDASAVPHITPSGTIVQPALMPALREIASATGGVALTGSDNWKLAFDSIGSDLQNYYSLGYRLTDERQDRLRNVQVRLKNKKYATRMRQSVIERSVASEMRDAVAANLFRPSANDLAIRVAAGATAASVIPVTVTIPMEKLTLLPDGSDLTAKFTVYAAFLRDDGAVSKVQQRPGEVRFPADSLKKRKELTVKIDVAADARTGALSIGVMDESTRATGFASVKLQ